MEFGEATHQSKMLNNIRTISSAGTVIGQQQEVANRLVKSCEIIRTERQKRAFLWIKTSIINANHRCSKETDCTAAQVVLQDMLQVWSQESYLYYKVQEVPRQPNEAKEQDAGSQEVSKL